METIERRIFMKGAAVSALAFTVGGARVFLTAREARAQQIPFKILTADQSAALEALGDTLLPGAKDAGIAQFVDQQLSVDPGESLLVARLLGILPPYADFYRAVLQGLDRASRKLHNKVFAVLAPDVQREFVSLMSRQNPDGWTGPPSPLFYFVARSDAVDVYYGTVEGFERLHVPYMPHILPSKKW
jgi:Gluconate 2-dehydrogenase subunit 3